MSLKTCRSFRSAVCACAEVIVNSETSRVANSAFIRTSNHCSLLPELCQRKLSAKANGPSTDVLETFDGCSTIDCRTPVELTSNVRRTYGVATYPFLARTIKLGSRNSTRIVCHRPSLYPGLGYPR